MPVHKKTRGKGLVLAGNRGKGLVLAGNRGKGLRGRGSSPILEWIKKARDIIKRLTRRR